MVRIHPDPPPETQASVVRRQEGGAIAQLGERLLCKQEVIGSIPIGSTSNRQAPGAGRRAPATSREQQSAPRAKLIGDSSRNRGNNRLLFNNLE